MRAFFAVDLSKEVLSGIEELVSELRILMPGARWVAPVNLHLTLRFLGESDEQVLGAISKEITPTVERLTPFELNFHGVGFFPSPRRPRIFWAGVAEAPRPLGELHREMEQIVRRHGFEAERRGFSPHLTLARFKNTPYDPRFIDVAHEFEKRDFGTSTVEEVILYRSILRPVGAEYHVVRRFPLQGRAERRRD